MQTGGRGLAVGGLLVLTSALVGSASSDAPSSPVCLKGMWKGTGWWGGWHQSAALVGGSGAHEGTPAVRKDSATLLCPGRFHGKGFPARLSRGTAL